MVISIAFAFCTVIIMKQMYFLHHTAELGFSFQNRGAVEMGNEGQDGVLANHLRQIPEIMEIVDAERMINLFPQMGRGATSVNSWDDKPVDAESFTIELMYVSPEYISFYDFRLVAGEMLTDVDLDSLVLLNESAVKALGWHEPVGKNFGGTRGTYTVKGVIKDIYNYAPTISAKPTFYIKQPSSNERMMVSSGGTTVLFKYHNGMWKSCKERIEQMLKRENMSSNRVRIYNYEEEYNKFLKSENALIKLLSFVSAICVLICIFGFVSLVSLTCEERRKSIAIRKINGATSGDILDMFAKEYFLLLIIGAVIAFSAGYFIMQRWLEQYVKQTSIPVWIYLSIVFVMALVIVLCVGWQVYKASVENPAEVVKTA